MASISRKRELRRPKSAFWASRDARGVLSGDPTVRRENCWKKRPCAVVRSPEGTSMIHETALTVPESHEHAICAFAGGALIRAHLAARRPQSYLLLRQRKNEEKFRKFSNGTLRFGVIAEHDTAQLLVGGGGCYRWCRWPFARNSEPPVFCFFLLFGRFAAVVALPIAVSAHGRARCAASLSTRQVSVSGRPISATPSRPPRCNRPPAGSVRRRDARGAHAATWHGQLQQLGESLRWRERESSGWTGFRIIRPTSQPTDRRPRPRRARTCPRARQTDRPIDPLIDRPTDRSTDRPTERARVREPVRA